jgi:glycosidase
MFALLVGAAPASAAPAGLKLHVPSPDWRDQIVYFVLTDRFADGNPANNNQGAGEFKAGDNTRYNGGDLAGLTQRLPYIRGLGATTLWVTPPVANQWVDPSGGYAGYHGYWAENFLQVDRHLGTLTDYQKLSSALHRSGMYLMQDIVVNHTGNYYTYRDRWNPLDPAQGYEPHDQTAPVPRPSQPPFDRNDPRDPAQQRQGIYHWTPDVVDYSDVRQEQTFQMSGLDDLNTENPVVRQALRRSYGHWIREVGVDAFRIDTAFYVPPDYFKDFLHARDPQAPGIAEVARRTGRRQFHVFGEGFAFDKPGQDSGSRKIEGYMTAPDGQPLLPGMLNFPLYAALGDAFARGHPPAELGQRITTMMQVHARPHWMPTFVDNHDVDRFLSGGNVAGLKQALLAMMTLPGIPVIYYGTEQAFSEQRAAMFAAGFASGGRDRYDTAAPLYRAIAEMSALRRSHKLFTRGTPTVLAGQQGEPGVLAWRMAYRGQSALVVFNTADGDAVRPQLATGLPAGTVLRGWYGLDGKPAAQVVGAGGRLTLNLPPRSGQVWQVTARRAVPPPEPALATAGDGAVPAAWALRADVTDPAGDDSGPGGQYLYPSDPGWGANRQMDLRRLRVSESSGALQLDLEMAGMTAGWSPANGFDRVAFTIFIELPGQGGGATVMPLQNASLPAGMRWHVRLRAGGWTNALFGPAGASATNEGTTIRPAATIRVDRDARSVRFTLPASVLGRLPSLSGAKIYVTTWDYDGGYRALGAQAQGYVFGGGAADGAKVMDDSAVIVLP